MVTVGMNYEIRPGKEVQFEKVFDSVLDIMQSLPGHQETNLFRQVHKEQMYLIVSQLADRASLDAFIESDQFKKVVDWGKEQVLASRPKHEVYGDVSPSPDAAAGCPMHGK